MIHIISRSLVGVMCIELRVREGSKLLGFIVEGGIRFDRFDPMLTKKVLKLFTISWRSVNILLSSQTRLMLVEKERLFIISLSIFQVFLIFPMLDLSWF